VSPNAAAPSLTSEQSNAAVLEISPSVVSAPAAATKEAEEKEKTQAQKEVSDQDKAVDKPPEPEPPLTVSEEFLLQVRLSRHFDECSSRFTCRSSSYWTLYQK
jgi:hypothetical protein